VPCRAERPYQQIHPEATVEWEQGMWELVIRLILQRHSAESLLVDLLCGVGSCCGRVGLVDDQGRVPVYAFGAARSRAGVCDRADRGAGT
jgi:hypothetical protein